MFSPSKQHLVQGQSGGPLKEAAIRKFGEMLQAVSKSLFHCRQFPELWNTGGMIDFEYWFDSVICACDFVTSTVPQRVWVQGEKNVTSVHDCNEFLEQTLGELDLEQLVPYFADSLRLMAAYEPVVNFCHKLMALERSVATEEQLGNPRQLLDSSSWASLVQAAKRVLELPAVRVRVKLLSSLGGGNPR